MLVLRFLSYLSEGLRFEKNKTRVDFYEMDLRQRNAGKEIWVSKLNEKIDREVDSKNELKLKEADQFGIVELVKSELLEFSNCFNNCPTPPKKTSI